MNVITALGSHGAAQFDATTGTRIGGDAYPEMARIDLTTTNSETCVDVLAVGFWTPEGEYAEPVTPA